MCSDEPPSCFAFGCFIHRVFCLYAFLKAYNRSVRRTLVVVGPSGLEPPTSRLSGVRSNLLSYGPVLGGDERNRTADPLLARQVLSQLSYTPIF